MVGHHDRMGPDDAADRELLERGASLARRLQPGSAGRHRRRRPVLLLRRELTTNTDQDNGKRGARRAFVVRRAYVYVVQHRREGKSHVTNGQLSSGIWSRRGRKAAWSSMPGYFDTREECPRPITEYQKQPAQAGWSVQCCPSTSPYGDERTRLTTGRTPAQQELAQSLATGRSAYGDRQFRPAC